MVAPRPCRRSSGFTGSGLDRRDAARDRVDVADAQSARGLRRRGGGQEPDPEVQVEPDLQAALAERLHPAAEVPGDLAPGGRVGAQHRVGAAPGGIQTRCPVFEDHVVTFAAVLHADPDARAADVEHGRVEALDQPLQRTAAGSLPARSSLWIAVTARVSCSGATGPNQASRLSLLPVKSGGRLSIYTLKPKYT